MKTESQTKAAKRRKSPFEREKWLMTALAGILDLNMSEIVDPENEKDETGADIIAVVDSNRIGIQVTEFDAGAGNRLFGRGKLRGEEKKRAKKAEEDGHPNMYVGGAPATPELALADQVADKVRNAQGCDFSKLKEAWLLISANLNEWGSMNSTFAGLGSIKVNEIMLNGCCGGILAQSKFSRAYLHMIVGKTLYEWLPQRGWKLLREEKPISPDDPGVKKWRKLLRS